MTTHANRHATYMLEEAQLGHDVGSVRLTVDPTSVSVSYRSG